MPAGGDLHLISVNNNVPIILAFSEIVAAADITEDEPTTRLGLIQTRANVDALVVGRSRRSGQRVDGKPWTMVTAHLWDGERVI